MKTIKNNLALAGVAQWIEHGLRTKVSQVRFSVSAHAWVAGQVPSRGRIRGNHTLMFPPVLPFPVSKNKVKSFCFFFKE